MLTTIDSKYTTCINGLQVYVPPMFSSIATLEQQKFYLVFDKYVNSFLKKCACIPEIGLHTSTSRSDTPDKVRFRDINNLKHNDGLYIYIAKR